MGKFHPAAKKQDIDQGCGVVSTIEGKSIAIFNVDGEFFAISNVCPHRGGPLGEGELQGCVVTCPWHGWEFNVTTGCNPDNANAFVEQYTVEVQGDEILVEIG